MNIPYLINIIENLEKASDIDNIEKYLEKIRIEHGKLNMLIDQTKNKNNKSKSELYKLSNLETLNKNLVLLISKIESELVKRLKNNNKDSEEEKKYLKKEMKTKNINEESKKYPIVYN